MNTNTHIVTTRRAPRRPRLALVIAAAALLTAAPLRSASAQTAPSLDAAQTFAVFGGATVTNTGATIINGDLGVSPGTAVTGFPPGLVNGGAIHAADVVALQAGNATTAAYLNLAGQNCPASNTFGVPTDLGGLTLVPGVYCFASSAGLTGRLTLDALGNPDAVWIFQVASTLISEVNSSVVIVNGGQDCNVFWQVGSSATLKVGTTFVGNILALTSIALQTNTDLAGRALARNGAVTLDTNTVGITSCAAPVAVLAPTVAKNFSPNPIDAGGQSTLTITLSNPDPSIAASASITDTLPNGVTLINGSAITTCGGAVTAGATFVTLTGGSIPANGTCTLTASVTAANAGSFVNSIVSGALQTSHGGNAAAANATLTVLAATPGLSLTKTASTGIYTAAGQTIVYSYVVTNIGSTVLTGPFTVTDDKLGAFVCGSAATTLAPGATVTCTRSYTTQASDVGTDPHGVIANINTGDWLSFKNSSQDTKITGGGAGAADGTYACWCVQDHVSTDLHNQPAALYSTVEDNLPAVLPNARVWNKVNYTLNHKIRGAGRSNLSFIKDVQTAIWVAVGELHPEFGVSPAAQQMIDEANANSSFVPNAGDITAVLLYSDGILPLPKIRSGEIQESICEMKPLKTIVNHATVSGGGVQSVQVQATVNQVR